MNLIRSWEWEEVFTFPGFFLANEIYVQLLPQKGSTKEIRQINKMSAIYVAIWPISCSCSLSIDKKNIYLL